MRIFHRAQVSKGDKKAAAGTPVPLVVKMAPLARAQLGEYEQRALSAPMGAWATVWSGLHQFITKVLPVGELALHRGNYSGIPGVFRLKQGRYRMFYLVSTQLRQVVILSVGYRKAGDKNDAYAELRRHIAAGVFDPQFEELAVKKPKA
jgi:hypothetical protein